MTYYSHEWHDNPPKVGIKFFYGVAPYPRGGDPISPVPYASSPFDATKFGMIT